MSRSVCLFSLLLGLCFVVTDCAWEDGDNGVDRPNGDLPSMPIALNASDQPKHCAGLCQQNKDCTAWAYCVPNCGGGQANPSCYLKGSVTQQAANLCRVS